METRVEMIELLTIVVFYPLQFRTVRATSINIPLYIFLPWKFSFRIQQTKTKAKTETRPQSQSAFHPQATDDTRK
jgi:hypothetical protein